MLVSNLVQVLKVNVILFQRLLVLLILVQIWDNWTYGEWEFLALSTPYTCKYGKIVWILIGYVC